MAKRGLGRGIDALLKGLEDDDQPDVATGAQTVPVDSLRPNPHQPRKSFSDDALRELADSIKSHGVLQPILVEPGEDGTYTIIAGERRFRAAKLAGLAEVPVLLRTFDEREKLEIALIENIQREDLNPVEEALAYRSLLDSTQLSQDELSSQLGKSRSAIANSLRLLKLPKEVQADLVSGELSAGHARALLSVEKQADVRTLHRRIVDEGLSVREAEVEAKRLNDPTTTHKVPSASKAQTTKQTKSVALRDIEERLITTLGTKVVIAGTDTKGKIEISYFSMDDLQRLAEILGVIPQ